MPVESLAHVENGGLILGIMKRVRGREQTVVERGIGPLLVEFWLRIGELPVRDLAHCFVNRARVPGGREVVCERAGLLE